MKVRMKTLAAGPRGVYLAGSVVDVPEDEGEALCSGGYAEAVEAAQTPVSVFRESLMAKTVRELKSMADEAGLDLGRSTRKSDIVALLMREGGVSEGVEQEPSEDAGGGEKTESAEAGQGENAASRTGKPQPRRRRPVETYKPPS